MAEGISDVGTTERVGAREVGGDDKDLSNKDKDAVTAAADRVDPTKVQGAAIQTAGANLTGGDDFRVSGTTVDAVGAGSVAAADQQLRGAALDARSRAMAGPGEGAVPPAGGPRDLTHFTNEQGARGMLRNGPRAGESGLAFFTGKDSTAQAGRGADAAPWKATVGVQGEAQATLPYRGQPGEPSWRGFYDQAKLENPNASEAELHARRNAMAQEYLRGRPEDSFSIRAERGNNPQTFEALKPNALAGAEVNALEPRVGGSTVLGSSAADAARGRLVANEVLSGNADAASRAARATGMGEGAANAFGRAATAAKWAGRVAVPVGVAADVYQVATSDTPVRTGVEKAAAWGTAYVGAKAGVATGAAIGAFGGPVGAAVGGVVGGIVGGVGGYFLGENAASRVMSWLGW